ncbi:hypothetical protein KH400_06210 [Desertibacillus haloalkaliphilus]|nr:hypothetical protein [Desertibacillus haloalkaliphilus]
MLLIGALLTPLFLYFLIANIKYSRSEEAKSERGQIILLKSYKHAIGIMPVGWFCLEMFHRYIHTITFDTYRDSIWVLVLLTYIVHGFSLYINRNQPEKESDKLIN